MKRPKRWLKPLDALDPFVLAARTPEVRDALRLLFLAGGAVSTAGSRSDCWLVQWHADEAPGAVVPMSQSRADLAWRELGRSVLKPLGKHAVRAVVENREQWAKNGAGSDDAAASVVASLVSDRKAGLNELLVPMLVSRSGVLMGGIAGLIVDFAQRHRARHMASLGVSTDEYDVMVSCARQVGGICSPVARVSWREGGAAELAINTSEADSWTSDVADDTATIELLRVRPSLAELKSADRDVALPAFMAAYLGAMTVQFDPVDVFAAAEFDGHPGEIDVYVPMLRLGYEVKLYHAPAAESPSTLGGKSGELVQQARHYANLGCQKMVVVTNLDQHNTELLDQAVRERHDGLLSIEFVAGDPDALLDHLDDILAEIAAEADRRWKRKVKGHLAKADKHVKVSDAADEPSD